MSSTTDDDPLAGSLAIVLYPAMLSATLAGQLLGIGLESAAGSRALWIPLAISTVAEAFAGARVGAARTGHPLDRAHAGRISMIYSGIVVVMSVVFAVWLGFSQPGGPSPEFIARWTPLHVAVGAAVAVVATVVRWALMVAFAPRAR